MSAPAASTAALALGIDVGTLKIFLTLVVFASALLSVLAPLAVVSRSEALFSVGNMMASGVLLAAALTHQLADSSALLNYDEDGDEGYPWSMLICGSTFIAFLILEEGLHLMMGEGSHDEEDVGGMGVLLHGHSHGHTEHEHKQHGHEHHEHEHHEHKPYGTAQVGHSHSHMHAQCRHGEEAPLVSTGCRRSQLVNRRSSIVQMKIENANTSLRLYTSTRNLDAFELDKLGDDSEASSEHEDISEPPKLPRPRRQSLIQDMMTYDKTQRAEVQHHHDDTLTRHLFGSQIASLMLFLALSLHSIMEGVSIGISPEVDQVVATGTAIMAHKAFAGYALGSTMVAAKDMSTRQHFWLSLVFSSTTPVGVLVGFLLLNSFDDSANAVGVVQAMVAGTFLYVSIVEVGMKELLICRHDDGSSQNTLSVMKLEILKLSFFLFGFLAMSGLAAFV